MNAPAKRFSLQRLLTTPAPAPLPEPAVVAPPVEFATVAEVPPAVDRPIRAPRTAPEETSHPKKKRSYSVDMKLCEDLEILSWYMSRSSSSVVEELIRKHLQHNKSVLLKAREVRAAR